MAPRIPPLFISHGSPSLYLETSSSSYSFYQKLGERIRKEHPNLEAVVVVSAHWETDSTFRVNTSPNPPQIYDFYGFPKHMYDFKYPAKGHPGVAQKVLNLVQAAKLPIQPDPKHGFDHGTWSPLSIVFPKADVPLIQLSLHTSMDPELHLQLGRALAPLQYENVLIIGSGSATHNLRDLFGAMGGGGENSQNNYAHKFDRALTEVLTINTGAEREKDLIGMNKFSEMRKAHPSHEHFAPVYVVVGAAGDSKGVKINDEMIFGSLSMSCFSF